MSAVTTIADTLVTRIAAILSSHHRLSNPYSIDQNNDRFLKQGWGLAIGEGANTPRYLSKQHTTTRFYTLSITRQYYATEFDVTSKFTTEKQLFEDLALVVKDLETNNTLNDGLYITTYESDNGIEPVSGERDTILAVRARISVSYSENFGP